MDLLVQPFLGTSQFSTITIFAIFPFLFLDYFYMISSPSPLPTFTKKNWKKSHEKQEKTTNLGESGPLQAYSYLPIVFPPKSLNQCNGIQESCLMKVSCIKVIFVLSISRNYPFVVDRLNLQNYRNSCFFLGNCLLRIIFSWKMPLEIDFSWRTKSQVSQIFFP